MNGRITEHGFLEVERNGEWITQKCIQVPGNVCGHWCPFMNEISGVPTDSDDLISLECSHKSVSFRLKGEE